jgi:hypothetical protein
LLVFCVSVVVCLSGRGVVGMSVRGVVGVSVRGVVGVSVIGVVGVSGCDARACEEGSWI